MLATFARVRLRWLEEKQDSGWTHPLVQLAFTAIRAGKPLMLDAARQQLGLSSAELSQLVARFVDRGLLTLDERGEIVTGAIGLSIMPSKHRVLLDGRSLYVWCALDIVGIPAALGADARAESRSADTDEAVWLEIEAGRVVRASHPQLHVSLTPPDAARSLCGST